MVNRAKRWYSAAVSHQSYPYKYNTHNIILFKIRYYGNCAWRQGQYYIMDTVIIHKPVIAIFADHLLVPSNTDCLIVSMWLVWARSSVPNTDLNSDYIVDKFLIFAKLLLFITFVISKFLAKNFLSVIHIKYKHNVRLWKTEIGINIFLYDIVTAVE